MDPIIKALIEKLEFYIRKASQSGNKYDFINPAYDICSELNGLEEAIEPVLLLIERSPDIDYGGPGPLGAFLEAFNNGVYEQKLLASLDRKPAIFTVQLLDTLLQDSNDARQPVYLDVMRRIATDPSLPEKINREALENLQYALEHLYPWDNVLKERLDLVNGLLEEVEAQQQSLKANQQHVPISRVSYGNVIFKVLTRSDAATYLPKISDLSGVESLYDVWDEWRFPTWHENGCFLLAEEDVAANNFQLDYHAETAGDITILGFIFLKGLKLDTYLLAFDTDNSPALIVHGDLICPNIHLSGNIHYVGGQVRSDLIWARYNHGELFLNGRVEAKVVLADGMCIYIRQLTSSAALVSLMGMNIYLKQQDGAEWIQKESTHGVGEVFVPELLEIDPEGYAALREEGADTAIIKLKQNKQLLV